MPLVNLQNLHIAFGHVALLDGVYFTLEKGERVCLIGRNGEGKSTLMKIVSRQILADDGGVEIQDGCRVAYLTQEPEFDANMSVFHAVAAGLGEVGQWIEEYHALTLRLSQVHDDEQAFNKMMEVQHHLEAHDGWSLEQKVEKVISKLELPAEQLMGELSGGWKRRVALAQILVTEPEILLLDEPTNHLDIEAIQWLEEVLLEFKGGLLFVSHDRVFMQHIATRIIELDRGKLTSYPNRYDTYLEVKQANLEAEQVQNAKFDKFLAQEEVWIRQGIKARRTRNEGRVRRLEALRRERAARREQMGTMKLAVSGADLSGKIVVEVDSISKQFNDKSIIKNFSTTILRGDKIGLIGANGAGKSTLLKLLLGDIQPDSGTVKHGTQLNVVYFDQLREELNPDETLADAVGQGREMVTLNGQQKHVISYLGDFLFPAARARSPVKTLSGGERNRLLLARLFLRPSNVLVMDEPTNDLDVESLELLEEVLTDYPGTLLLVSHDRRFLDNVVTSTFAFEGNGRVLEYVGGYEDWLRQRKISTAKAAPSAKNSAPVTAVKTNEVSIPVPAKRKLNNKEQRELAELPKKIEKYEAELTELQLLVSQSDFYKQAANKQVEVQNRIKALETELAQAYERWEALDG